MKYTIVAILCAVILATEAAVVPTIAIHTADGGSPLISLTQHVGPAPIVIPAVEGTYVAKTLGAVHVAPLPGHSQSATSVNLEPAPGSK